MKLRLARLTTAAAGVAVALATCLSAQAPAGTTPAEFEAASVKRSDPGAQGQSLGFQPGGRMRATNVTLRLLIASAYGTPQPLPPFQVFGGPDWIDKDRFDITAKAAGDPAPGPNGPPPIMFQMIQTLLANRFKLKVHREARDLPMYALVTVRSDGSAGTGLRRSTVDCSALFAAARAGAPPPAPNTPFCGLRGSPGRLTGASADMTILANSLSRGVNRPVQDRTGLSGKFDFDLEWTPTPDQMPTGPLPAGITPPVSDGPSIFTALQEQLGLKLESTRGPVDVLVIDGVEHPSEN